MASIASQSPVSGSGAPQRQEPFLRLQSVMVYVRNLDRSLAFYLDLLGFQIVFDGRSQPGQVRQPWVVVSPPDGTANLTLIVPRTDSEQYKQIGRASHVTFVTEDVLGKFREWSKRGVQFLSNPRLRRFKHALQSKPPDANDPSSSGEHSPPIWGAVFSRFRDPDGNTFSLVSFDEVTHAVETQRRAVADRQEAERRAAQELEIAQQVQARLFPQTLPRLRTLEYAGICHQARQVGGDYYDFLDLGGERLGLVVGDISGKGIAAALLMANLQANLRSQSALALDQPQRFLCAVNQLFCQNTSGGSFATLFFAEYNDAARRLRYINCGHLSALLLRADDSLERLKSTATILGAFKDWDCEVEESQLFSGDTLALYTDGITEAFSPHREEFGEERLVEALRRHRSLTPCEFLASVVNEVRQFSPHEQHDDITLIIAKCLPDGSD
ncbi:MAG TPA: SpoIIE family protein phosphatase [Candidatus Limnocylindrales bacterium]|nr:SpoIIE family protein phosphatase [Candidatus Limnocylindrales bacterium]